MMDDNDLDSFSMNSSSSACTEMGSEVIRYPGQHDVLFGRGGKLGYDAVLLIASLFKI